MTQFRATFVLFVFAVTALAVITLRTEQIRTGARIEAAQRERLELRRMLWSVELEKERLRTPDQIQERVERWSLNVSAPSRTLEPEGVAAQE